jgi:hypothetical protein
MTTSPVPSPNDGAAAAAADDDDESQRMIHQWLHDAGVRFDENTTPFHIDPSSRVALHGMLLLLNNNNNNNNSVDGKGTPCQNKQNKKEGPQTQPDYGPSWNNESKEERILKLLEEQTAMIFELNQRMEMLTTFVLMQQQQQQQQQIPPREEENGSCSSSTRTKDATTPTTTTGRGRNRPLPPATETALLARIHDVNHRAAAAAANNHPNEPPGVEPQGGGGGGPNHHHHHHHVWTMRVAKLRAMKNLFVALFQRQVPNLNLGMVIKVMVMMAILLSRLSQRRKRPPSSETDPLFKDYKYYFLMTIAMAAFLVQMGLVKFLYNFFVKEDYPWRIWQGEEIDAGQEGVRILQAEQQQQEQGRVVAAAAAAADREPPNNNNGGAQLLPAQEAEQPGWHYAFLTGGVAANDDDDDDNNDQNNHHNAGPFRLLQDVGFLVGSFFLSIFPMWKPQAVRMPAVPPPPPLEELAGNNNNNNTNPGLPQVQPPRDAFQAAEDDDDDNGDDEPREIL